MKNKTWICRDYTHITETLVLLRRGTEMNPEKQWILDEIEKISDLHFILTKEMSETIDPKKFSESHMASSYSICQDQTGIQGILGSIEYDRVIYPGQHLYYFILDCSKLDVVPENLGKIIEASEILSKSIFKISRIQESELSEYYTKPDAWYKRISRDNTYSTHRVTSKAIMIKPELYQEITNYLSRYPGYLETFLDFPRFLGSVTIRLKNNKDLFLNQDIKDVKISTVGVQS